MSDTQHRSPLATDDSVPYIVDRLPKPNAPSGATPVERENARAVSTMALRMAHPNLPRA